ncbi:hypothetical protein PMAYCL1PPCAC_24103, partial [Pristionchus mayeri]
LNRYSDNTQFSNTITQFNIFNNSNHSSVFPLSSSFFSPNFSSSSSSSNSSNGSGCSSWGISGKQTTWMGEENPSLPMKPPLSPFIIHSPPAMHNMNRAGRNRSFSFTGRRTMVGWEEEGQVISASLITGDVHTDSLKPICMHFSLPSITRGQAGRGD